MNLSNNTDNKQINQCITDCASWISNMETRFKKQEGEFRYYDTPVTNLMNVSRDYFKREWDRAKRGK